MPRQEPTIELIYHMTKRGGGNQMTLDVVSQKKGAASVYTLPEGAIASGRAGAGPGSASQLPET